MVCTPGSERPKCRDLALRDELLDRAGDLLDRHVRVDAVLVEEVDVVGPQPLERGLGDLLDVLGAAVHAALPGLDPGLEVEAELGGDHDLLAYGLERLAHELLVGERAVGLGRVEERHAAARRRRGSATIICCLSGGGP